MAAYCYGSIRPFRCQLRFELLYHTARRAHTPGTPLTRIKRCAALSSFWRARNNFTLIVFSFMPVICENSSTEWPSTSFKSRRLLSSFDRFASSFTTRSLRASYVSTAGSWPTADSLFCIRWASSSEKSLS